MGQTPEFSYFPSIYSIIILILISVQALTGVWASPVSENYTIFILHAKKGWRGDRVHVDLTGCQNLHAFNKKVSSVTLDKDKPDSCIRLHDHFGCAGRNQDVGGGDNNGCAEDLSVCGFGDATSSVSGCDYKLETSGHGDGDLPLSDTSTTTRGETCQSPCSMEKDTHYFWCYTDLRRKSWDYCSPVVGVDYYGNVCSAPCAQRSYSYSWCPCEKCRYTSRRKVWWKESWGYCSLA